MILSFITERHVFATFTTVTIALSPVAQAQQADGSPFQSFDQSTIERVRPEDIPDYRPGLPQGSSRQDIADLPRALSGDEMRRITKIAAATTVQIVAIHTPPKPYRATPLIYHGHALWISPNQDGSSPTLIATADWLQNADSIYLFEPKKERHITTTQEAYLSPAPQQTLLEHSVTEQNFIDKYAQELTPLVVEEADGNFNLARLRAGEGEELPVPDKGLILHNMDHTMPGSIFGYSPALGTTLLPLSYIQRKLEESLSFYFLTDFGAVLGAPILSAEGTLLAISALRHPENGAWSLAIPPGAIHAFLNTDQARAPKDGEDHD